LAYCSIFRNESEAKDDDNTISALRVHKVIAPDDEVAEGGYYTIPPIQTVASTASVRDFVVTRKGYGSISFTTPVDLTGITSLSILREIVEIEHGRVSLYPDKTLEPSPGSGLNVPAIVSLEKMHPSPDVELHEYTEQLRSRPDNQFLSYNPDSGVWIFKVDHFSVYGIEDS
jgi:Nucleoporin autopeptidase